MKNKDWRRSLVTFTTDTVSAFNGVLTMLFGLPVIITTIIVFVSILTDSWNDGWFIAIVMALIFSGVTYVLFQALFMGLAFAICETYFRFVATVDASTQRKKGLITVREIASLPPWARVSFIARVAERVKPILDYGTKGDQLASIRSHISHRDIIDGYASAERAAPSSSNLLSENERRHIAVLEGVVDNFSIHQRLQRDSAPGSLNAFLTARTIRQIINGSDGLASNTETIIDKIFLKYLDCFAISSALSEALMAVGEQDANDLYDDYFEDEEFFDNHKFPTVGLFQSGVFEDFSVLHNFCRSRGLSKNKKDPIPSGMFPQMWPIGKVPKWARAEPHNLYRLVVEVADQLDRNDEEILQSTDGCDSVKGTAEMAQAEFLSNDTSVCTGGLEGELQHHDPISLGEKSPPAKVLPPPHFDESKASRRILLPGDPDFRMPRQ